MKVAFVVPGDINQKTGGYIYDRKVVKHLRDKGVDVEIISSRHKPFIFSFFGNFWLFLRFIYKGYNVIIEDEMTHSSTWLFNLLARHIRKTRIMVIVHLLRWTVSQNSLERSFVKFIEKRMLSSTNLIISNSRYTEKILKSMGLSTKIEVICPGYDLHPFKEKKIKNDDSINLLFVGNCHEGKGVEYLIEAMKELDNSKIKLCIVGDTNFDSRYYKKIRMLIQNYRLTDRIIFRSGKDINTITEYYSSADIFVLPSLYEGYGIVSAEAMYFGLPIIATDVGGIPEIVNSGSNGILVPPKDSKKLSNAIDKLSRDTNLREKYGEESHKLCRGLNSWEKCCEQFFSKLC